MKKQFGESVEIFGPRDLGLRFSAGKTVYKYFFKRSFEETSIESNINIGEDTLIRDVSTNVMSFKT